MSDYEKQGTGYDPGATGHELQGRQSSPTPTAGEARVLEIAWMIDPEAFAKYDAEVATGRLAENGRLWADVCYGKDIDAAKAKARAIASLPPGEGVVEALRDVIEFARDSRYSSEAIGIAFRARLEALSLLTQGGDAK